MTIALGKPAGVYTYVHANDNRESKSLLTSLRSAFLLKILLLGQMTL